MYNIKEKFLSEIYEKNYAGDAKKAHSALLMKKFLKVKKIDSKEQSSKQEQALIDSMMTKIERSETCDKNPATLGIDFSFENQGEGSQNHLINEEVKTIEERPNSSTKTDVSECASVASKKSDNGYGSNKNMECRKILTNFGKNCQNSSLDKVIPTKENAELTSIYGLLICCYFQ